MRLALQLGMHLHELYGWSGPITHRQYEAWQQFMEDEWSHPSRSDWYAMQIAHVMARTMGGSRADLADLQLKFSRAGSSSIKEETKWAQEKWFAAVGYHGKRN